MTIQPASAIPAEAWDQCVAGHPQGWLWHTRPWLRYRAARAGTTDRSFGVVDDDGRVLAACPLMDESGAWAFGGEPGPLPLATDAESAGMMAVHLAALEADLRPVVIAFAHRPCPASAAQDIPGVRMSWLTEVIDVSQPLDAILHGFRKCHRSGRTDVRKLAKQYPVVSGPEYFCDLIRAHYAFWGQKTWRPVQWEVIAEWLETGTALLVGVPGYVWALVYIYKGWAYYAACPSRDHTLGLPALCQWVALQRLQAAGVRYYEVGWHARPGEGEKAQRIAAYKRGFGGAPWVVNVVGWCSDGHERFEATT